MIGRRGRLRFQPLDVDPVRLIVDRHVRLVTWKSRESVFRPATRDNAGLVLAGAASDPRVRELRQIVRHPVYLSDWSLAGPDWNLAGMVYFDQSPDLIGLRPNPDAARCQEILADLVIDFPFRTEADRHNAIGMLLPPLIRPAVSTVPLHLVVASLERTGKTKLASELLGGILLGENVPVTQLPAREEELEKRVLGFLAEDVHLVLLDNIRSLVDSPSLAALLTARTFRGRLLGRTQILELPNNLVVLGTGNNVATSGEIAKRSIPILLQPRNDHPEARTDFKHPALAAHVACVRRQVFEALIGGIELWKQAGRPPHPDRTPLGGFEEWSEVVGGVLYLLGFTEWRANDGEWRRAADPRGEDLKQLVKLWYSKFGSNPQSAKELASLAEQRDLYPDCFSRPTAHAKTQAFVKKVLGPAKDRPVGDYIVRRADHGNSARFFLERTR